MPTLTFKSRFDVPVDDLFAWHARPGAFERLVPPWTDVRLEHFEGIRDGQRAVIRIGAGPVGLRWVAEHHDYREGRQFCDRQVKGPFAYWDHRHRMEPEGPGASFLIDQIEYAPPLGGLGELFGSGLLEKELGRQFGYRHRVTGNDLALHRRYGHTPLRVAVTGASGLIGKSLAALLTTGGHEVIRMVRSRPTAPDEVYWNPRTGEIDAGRLAGLDAVVHLAGENVFALRWTADKKRRIRESRVDGTRLLAETLAALPDPPRAFLCASAIGYYGNRGSDVLTEDAAAGTDGFLTAVTRDWEAAAQPAVDAGLRTVFLRIGLVLSPQGGALRTMLPAFRLGLGGSVGAKNAYLSWITLDDVVGAIYHALATDVSGPLNLTAPAPSTMRTFTRTLARVLRRPAFAAVPGVLARMAGGEMADELLTSACVLPRRLQQSAYGFLFPDLVAALSHQLGSSQPPSSPQPDSIQPAV